MADVLVNTKIEVKQCVRCGELVFECYSGGLHVSAEPAAVSLEQYRQALISDKRTFCIVQNAMGKPAYLVTMLLSDKFQPQRIVIEHSCGAVKHWSKAPEQPAKAVEDDPKVWPEGQGSEAIRLWAMGRHVVGGRISAIQNGSLERYVAPAQADQRSFHHSDAARLLADNLHAHPIFKDWT